MQRETFLLLTVNFRIAEPFVLHDKKNKSQKRYIILPREYELLAEDHA
jgi:hypothetical protein